jgi:hypothetical protein
MFSKKSINFHDCFFLDEYEFITAANHVFVGIETILFCAMP